MIDKLIEQNETIKSMQNNEDSAIKIMEMYKQSKLEIERLKEELKYTIPIVEHNKTITKHLKEIERLNNIINELERTLYQDWLEWKDSACESNVVKAQEDKEIYDYLQELKDSDK